MDYAQDIQNAALQRKGEHPDTLKYNAAIIEQLRSLGAKTATELQ